MYRLLGEFRPKHFGVPQTVLGGWEVSEFHPVIEEELCSSKASLLERQVT